MAAIFSEITPGTLAAADVTGKCDSDEINSDKRV